MSLLAALDIDQPLPVVTPPSTPTADGIVLQTKQILDLFVVVAVEREENDLAALGERNACRPGLSKSLKNRLLFFGHNDLCCLPWHRLSSGEAGESEQLAQLTDSKQCQLVPAALAASA